MPGSNFRSEALGNHGEDIPVFARVAFVGRGHQAGAAAAAGRFQGVERGLVDDLEVPVVIVDAPDVGGGAGEGVLPDRAAVVAAGADDSLAAVGRDQLPGAAGGGHHLELL